MPVGAPVSKVTMAHGATDANLGVHIANRLVEVGCTTAFAVPGKLMSIAFQPLRGRAGTHRKPASRSNITRVCNDIQLCLFLLFDVTHGPPFDSAAHQHVLCVPCQHGQAKRYDVLCT